MSNVKQHEMSCNLRSLSPMSRCLGSQWRDKNSSSPEGERRAGAEKNLAWYDNVIPLSSCPVSSVHSSHVHCPVSSRHCLNDRVQP